MAGAGNARIRDKDDPQEIARVVNGRLLVSSTGGGGGGGDVNLAQYGGVAVGPGNPLDVDGTVDVGNFPASQTVDGTLTVEQSTHADLNATVRVQDSGSGELLDIITTNDTTPLIPSGITGMMFYPSDSPSLNQGEWIHLHSDEEARLIVADTSTIVRPIEFSTQANGPGVALDASAATLVNNTIAPAAVRNDVLASLVSADGDYAPFQVDEDGALWTRDKGDTVTTDHLSGSTDGRGISIVATTTPGTTLHTASASGVDRVYIDLGNTGSSAVVVTIQWGGTTAADERDVVVPPNETVRAVDGIVLTNSLVIRAYASTSVVVNATGRVETLS